MVSTSSGAISGESPRRTLGFLVIATGPYLDMAASLASDLDGLAGAPSYAVNLLTDRVEDAERLAEGLHALKLNVLEIPAFRWPEATLLRFDLFRRHEERIIGDDLFYLDADMRVAAPLDDALRRLDDADLLGVRHPGFFNRGWRHPRGSWETRRASAAFVPRRKRRRYAAGGAWLGKRDAVLGMSGALARRVDRDRENGVMAVWHDESHWNWFVSEHRIPLLSPAYCYAEGYPWLSEISPVIIAVDKGSSFEREQSDQAATAAWHDEN